MKMKWSKWIGLTTLVFLMTLLFGMTALGAPSAPTGLKQTGANDNAIRIEWNLVSGSDIYYQIEYSQNGSSWGPAHTGDISDTTYTIGGLATAKNYYFRVRAYEKGTADYSSWSPSLTVTTSPGLIPKVQQTNATKSSVTLKWTASAGANSYEVWYFDPQKETPISLAKRTSSLTVTISNLSNSKQYAFMVYPLRTCGSYTALNSGRGMYVALLPGKVSGFKLSAGDSKSQVLVEWKENLLASGYQLILYNNKGKKVKSVTVNAGYTNFKVLTNVKSTSFYKVKIRAFVKLSNGAKYGAWNEIYLANQPKLKASLHNGGIKLTWPKVAGATNYTVYASTSNSGYKKVATVKTNSYVSYKVKNQKLSVGKYYYYKVVSNKKVKGKTYKSSSDKPYPFGIFNN